MIRLSIILALIVGCTMQPPSTIQLCLLASCDSEAASGDGNKQSESTEADAKVSPL